MAYTSPFNKDKTLSNVVSQLKKASKMHLAQAEIVEDHIKEMETASPINCWDGYERVPGTKKGAKGSCRKKSAALPKKKTKGGGTRKVCLPADKVRSMSAAEKRKVISAKESAASKGKQKRSSKSNVKGARKKGATLKDWFEKENWINVKTGKPCGD